MVEQQNTDGTSEQSQTEATAETGQHTTQQETQQSGMEYLRSVEITNSNREEIKRKIESVRQKLNSLLAGSTESNTDIDRVADNRILRKEGGEAYVVAIEGVTTKEKRGELLNAAERIARVSVEMRSKVEQILKTEFSPEAPEEQREENQHNEEQSESNREQTREGSPTQAANRERTWKEYLRGGAIGSATLGAGGALAGGMLMGTATGGAAGLVLGGAVGWSLGSQYREHWGEDGLLGAIKQDMKKLKAWNRVEKDSGSRNLFSRNFWLWRWFR